MSKSDEAQQKLPILIFTHAKRDAELTVDVLRRAGFNSIAVSEFQTLISTLEDAGAVVLSEEVLTQTYLEQLHQKIESQPRWSDLPLIVVTSAANSSVESHERLERIASYLQNLTLLERPIRLATLITIVKTSLASRRKQFELKSTLEELESSKIASEEANQAKSLFLANMSHEIRTPLAAIVGFTSLMRDQHLPMPERLGFADVIARNGDQLSSLINDILDLSKVEAGKLEIEKTEVSFPAFFAEVTSWLRPVVERKGLNFHVELRSKLPSLLVADTTRIRQVLLNVVSNAAKFTEQGQIKIIFNAEPLAPLLSKLNFEITDTGIGMNEQDQSRLFQQFSQADASVTRKYGGTGLGLVLSKALAQAMGGDLVLVRSTPGVGSVFKFFFTAELLNEDSRVAVPKNSPDALKGLTVLLVEDSPDNQFLMKRYLSGAGAQVTTANDGKTACELALGSPFDVILMDIQMPIMDGLTATQTLRAANYSAPIIALTAHALREEKDRSLAAGCNDHLTKPIDREVLITTLLEYLPKPARS